MDAVFGQLRTLPAMSQVEAIGRDFLSMSFSTASGRFGLVALVHVAKHNRGVIRISVLPA
jgi:hypothetical protein